MESFCICGGDSQVGGRHRCEEAKKATSHHNVLPSSMRSRPTTLPVVAIAVCLLTGGDALSISIPLPHSSTPRPNSISCIPYNCPLRATNRRHNLQLRSISSTSNQENQRNPERRQQTNSVSAATPFNHDIARTLFAPLFFSLYHYKNNNDGQNYSSSSSFRHHYTRPSPFEDPSCAQTTERMLRRMMENRYRSEGRTVCPDGRTFGLVAGAYGRLRWGQRSTRSDGRKSGGRANNSQNSIMVILEEEVTPVDKLQGLLQLQLRLCHREGWSTEIRPTVDMYNRVLKRLARQSGMLKYQGNNSSAEQALLWLQFMRSPIPQYHGSDKKCEILCRPDPMTYAHVINTLSAHRDTVSSEKLNPNTLLGKSDLSTYESIHDFVMQIDVKMIESETQRTRTSEMYLVEAETLLALLEDEYYNNMYPVGSPTKDKVERAMGHAYTCLAEGWGRNAVKGMSNGDGTLTSQVVDAERSSNKILHNREHSIQRAHEILSQLEALSKEVPPSCYSSVVLALSVSTSPTAANLAEDVLERMIARLVGGVPSRFVNDVAKAFSGCIAAHARNNDAPKAENVLYQMIDLYYDGRLGTEFVPDVRAFGTCIALWGKYSSQDTSKTRRKNDRPSYHQRIYNADRAEAILSEMESVADNEKIERNAKFALDATPYNAAILARVQTIDDKWKNSALQEENERVILHAQSILDHMEYDRKIMPDSYTYSILLNAWCQQSRPGNEKAADHAEELLRRRIEDVDIIKIIADRDLRATKSRERIVVDEIWPNVKHYSSVLKAHAKTKSPGGAKKALTLLCEMERRYYDADLVEGAEYSDNINDFHVDQKDVAKPDLVCYSIVIDAFANSRLPEASTVALRLLRAVETKYDAGDESMKPNTRIYTAAILSLVHSPFSADEDNDDDYVIADKHITNNAQRAWSILEKMKMNQVPPNSFTYNYIINAAAESMEDQRASFEVAVRAFQELRTKKAAQSTDTKDDALDSCHPDSFTFSFMIKACNNLLPSGPLRTKVISQVFRDCCRSGYLNDAILDRVWRGLASETFYSLVEKKLHYSGGEANIISSKPPIKVDTLPSSWSRCCQLTTAHQPKGSATAWKKGARLASQ